MANKQGQINYQELSEELDQIITKIQDDATSIDEALRLYERGAIVVSQLEDYLKNAQNKLIKISGKKRES